jgi:prepilin-type N-terminal cleavage/methylation domain-containing protein
MRGFSLVELSIVLVILGLLTGGILTGQNLIRAAELRSVVTEFQRYQTATQTFRNQYFGLPGDITNGTDFWGKNETACSGDSGDNAGDSGTCNGNGDGIVSESGSVGGATESFQFWHQLALAGLIEGSYTGLTGSVRSTDHDRGVNCPASRIAGGMWGSSREDNSGGGAAVLFAYDYRNALSLGTDDDNSRADGRIATAEESWSIDKKMDDGKPGTGKLHGFTVSGCANGTGSSDVQADYNLGNDANCALLFYQAY